MALSINNFSDRDRRLFIETFTGDGDSVHIFWNCLEGRTVRLCGRLIPDGVKDPLEYLRCSELVEPSARPSFELFCNKVESEINQWGADKRLSIDVPLRLRESRTYTLCHLSIFFGCGEDGRFTSAHINITPYSEKEISEREIIDIFTSEKAPKIFSQRIMRLMDKNTDRKIAFIQFDVDRFKLINDTYGVEMGDELLKYIKDSLTVICTDEQPFTRLTADVFMIVTAFDAENEIVRFIRNIEASMGRKYKDIEYRLTFGVAIAEDRKLHSRCHGDNATLARKSVKGNALNNIGFYNGSLKKELYHQNDIEEDMADAMLNNEFVMYLQPKYSISTGRIIGAEALARWMHPKKGLIPPGEFIPVFEKNGFIVKLDQLMWEKACIKIRSWIDRGITPVPVSVNISREYLNFFDVVGKFKELIEKYNIPIHLLEAEITESVDAAETADVVRQMKKCGFTMLMDDFGSGFSSLNMLKTTPFDVLKIDRGFLSEFMESERGRKIIAHTISMSRDIGLDIIAEGVETVDQAEFLQSCGCDTAQGFYYSKPISEEEFDKRLSSEQSPFRN